MSQPTQYSAVGALQESPPLAPPAKAAPQQGGLACRSPSPPEDLGVCLDRSSKQAGSGHGGPHHPSEGRLGEASGSVHSDLSRPGLGGLALGPTLHRRIKLAQGQRTATQVRGGVWQQLTREGRTWHAWPDGGSGGGLSIGGRGKVLFGRDCSYSPPPVLRFCLWPGWFSPGGGAVNGPGGEMMPQRPGTEEEEEAVVDTVATQGSRSVARLRLQVREGEFEGCSGHQGLLSAPGRRTILTFCQETCRDLCRQLPGVVTVSKVSKEKIK